jgi:tRNA1(Val) A37 N6-methylase TrmN6
MYEDSYWGHVLSRMFVAFQGKDEPPYNVMHNNVLMISKKPAHDKQFSFTTCYDIDTIIQNAKDTIHENGNASFPCHKCNK